MPRIQPTPEQISRAKDDMLNKQDPYFKALSRIMSLKTFHVIVDENGVHFDYGEETESEKELFKIINQIELNIQTDLYNGKY